MMLAICTGVSTWIAVSIGLSAFLGGIVLGTLMAETPTKGEQFDEFE